jgi:transcriptional regulator with XRE-family HTH domain
MKKYLVGKKIKEFRSGRNLSLEKLADLTGFTKGYLSRIENSPKPPPIYTLTKISSALGLDVSKLLSEEIGRSEAVEITITRNREHAITDGRGTPYGYVYEALAQGKLGKNMEPFLVTNSFKGRTDFQHEGEEFLYVLEGTLEFIFRDKSFILEKGDCAYFESGFPHGGRSLGEVPAKIMIVIYSYKRM